LKWFAVYGWLVFLFNSWGVATCGGVY
jgi:hypothetical protein